MAYNAGKNTSVRTVPPKVPPINVYASVPQNTEWVSGMNASMPASAVRTTGRERCADRNPATVVHSPRSTDFTNLCSTLPCATQVNGSSVSGFDAAKTSYTVTSPVYPAMISATAADNGTVAIQQPASLPGTATITV